MEVCGHPLTCGRTCCHLSGHAGRHSHTWQRGAARYEDIDCKMIDMETGEVTGYTGGLAQRIIETITGERDDPGFQPTPGEKRAKARRVLEVQYGFKFPLEGEYDVLPGDSTVAVPAGESIMARNCNWHWKGTDKAIGTDQAGHDVEFDYQSGKVTRIYSQNDRREAVSYARRFGPAKASRKLNIPAGTIRSWINREV